MEKFKGEEQVCLSESKNDRLKGRNKLVQQLSVSSYVYENKTKKTP